MKCVQESAAILASFSDRLPSKNTFEEGIPNSPSTRPFAVIHFACSLAQVDTVRIVMSVFGLVADDRHRAPFHPATAEESIDTGD